MKTIQKKLYDEKVAGAVYSVAAFLVLLFSIIFILLIRILLTTGVVADNYTESDWYKYLSFLFPQIGFFCTILLFFLFTNEKVKKVYSLPHWKYILIGIALAFGLFSLSRLNEYFLNFLSWAFGYKSPEISLPDLNNGKVVLVILVVALLPALLEETIFRSILLKPMQSFGTVTAVILCGALFSLYHQNPAQTVYQFCCGCAFALLAIRSGSVIPTIIAHFLNNAIIILLYYFNVTSFSTVFSIVFYTISGIVLVALLVYLIFFDKKTNQRKQKELKPFLLSSAVGIFLCGFMWIATLISGIIGV